MVADKRENVITVRLSPQEHEMIGELAEVDGISVSDVVRMSLRRVHAERFGVRPKAKRTKK